MACQEHLVDSASCQPVIRSCASTSVSLPANASVCLSASVPVSSPETIEAPATRSPAIMAAWFLEAQSRSLRCCQPAPSVWFPCCQPALLQPGSSILSKFLNCWQPSGRVLDHLIILGIPPRHLYVVTGRHSSHPPDSSAIRLSGDYQPATADCLTLWRYLLRLGPSLCGPLYLPLEGCFCSFFSSWLSSTPLKGRGPVRAISTPSWSPPI